MPPRVAAIEKITSERYLELLKIYRRQCGGDIQEAAGKMLLGCISEKARDIKWLAVGAGLGDREAAMAAAMRERSPDLAIKLLEVFEPNPHTCRYLKERTRSREDPLAAVENVVVNEAPFTPDTDLGGQRYDLVTLPHVMYYFRTSADRARMFDLLSRHLAPGGAIWILVMAEEDARSGQGNQQLRLYQELKPMIVARVKKEEPGGACKGDLVTGHSLWTEFEALADKGGMESKMDTFTYMLKLGPSVDSRTCFDLVSFILDCEVASLPSDTLANVVQWLRENSTPQDDAREAAILCMDSVLTFTKKM